MGILILGVFIVYFERKIKRNDSKTILWLHAVLLCFIILSVILNSYLEHVCGWQYGVAGADLTAHFNGAKALSEGIDLKDLDKIAYRFEISLSGLSYIIYALILKWISFSPIIISYRFSLQVFYTIQLILAVLSVDNICHLFENEKKKYNYILLLTVSSCVCILQQASILMRDIWVFYFLTCFFSLKYINKKDIVKSIILLVICFLMRNYTVLITLPFFVWKVSKKIKLGVMTSFAILLVFIFGQNLIGGLAKTYGIRWEFGFNFNFLSILKYILFPNILSQTYNVQHASTYQYSCLGGNTEWIYYILSVWNIYIYPLVAYGIYIVFTKKKKIEEGIIWLLQIVNIGLIYSVFYNSMSEPRHKLLILFGLIFFFNEAVLAIKKKILIVYYLLVSLIILLMFAMIG